MRTFEKISDLQALVGQELGVSGWMTITQEQINQFAQATGDHQWIHVDPARAAQGPFGTTVAHGFLTLSLLPVLLESCFTIADSPMGLNYGLNRVRFPAPVPVGSRLRARAVLQQFEPLPGGGAQLTLDVTIEREGQDKPVCAAQVLVRRHV